MNLIKCPECGKEMSDTIKNCTYCGYNLQSEHKKDMNNKKKKVAIIMLIIVGVIGIIISVVCYINYKNYQYEVSKKNELFSKIKQFNSDISWKELALIYNCSVEDLTIDNLQNSLNKYEETEKKYKTEQQQYNLKYKDKITEAKEKCITMIKNVVFEDDLYVMFNSYYNSSYQFSPKANGTGVETIAEINAENETLKKIGMAINYPCSITSYAVNINTGKTTINNESGTIVVQGELDLTTNKVQLYCIEGYNSIGTLIKRDGKPSDFISTYSIPRVISLKKNGTIQNTYEFGEYQEEIQDNKITGNNTIIEDNNIENKSQITTEPYEHIEIIDKTGINGEYTDIEYARSQGAGTYSVYVIQNGKVEYSEEYTSYIGTYTIEGNKLLITYTNAYETEEPIELDKFNDELTIKSDNKLINSNGIEFIKE